MRKFYSFILILSAMLCGFTSRVWGDELTIGDEMANNEYVPMYGWFADNFLHSPIIYPKGKLEALDGKEISCMTFHSKVGYTNISFGAATFAIRLKLVDDSSLSTSFLSVSDKDPVYSGTLSITSSRTMIIELTTPFVYDKSKNLLFDLQSTAKGGYSHVFFYGNSVSGASLSGYNSTSVASISNQAQQNFLPKTTFTYSAPATCPKPKNLVKYGSTATTATFTWNKGNSETQWQYICLPAATAVDWSSGSVQLTNSTTATITGLTTGTAYKFYVRAYCAADDQSEAVSKDFTTPCTGKSLPWSENFESLSTGSLHG